MEYNDDKADKIALEIQKLKPSWEVYTQWQACISVDTKEGGAMVFWFGGSNPTFGANFGPSFEMNCEKYVETNVPLTAPVEELAMAAVRAVEAVNSRWGWTKG